MEQHSNKDHCVTEGEWSMLIPATPILLFLLDGSRKCQPQGLCTRCFDRDAVAQILLVHSLIVLHPYSKVAFPEMLSLAIHLKCLPVLRAGSLCLDSALSITTSVVVYLSIVHVHLLTWTCICILRNKLHVG